MSTNAQRVQLGPFFSSGAIQGAAKLYHYAAGTSTLKNIWEERAMSTTLAQPFVADADGIFNFFADGLYKLIICGPDSTGPADDVLYTLDNWQFLDPSDPTFAEGTAIPTASTMNVGPEVWAHWSGSTNVDALSGSIPFHWAVADGNFTLNYSANLLTPASISVSVRSGDVLFFLNEGSGIWRLAAHYQYDGLVIATQDTRTNSADVGLTVRSTTSGTPAAGIGTDILLQAESTDENPSDVAQVGGSFSDVSAGSEDSYFRLLLRVAGAALTEVYRFVATGAFKAIFTHANSADRTYTLPNASGTIVVGGAGSGVVATADLKTATGSATAVAVSTYPAGKVTTTTDVTMNDYSFFPSLTTALTAGAGGTGSGDWQASDVADPSNTVGRVTISATASNPGGGGSTRTQTTTLRWRYVTASDAPEIWIAYDEGSGMILASWVSDDPTPDGLPGVRVPGCKYIRLTANDLVTMPEVAQQMLAAAAYIQSKGLKLQHQAYRALQLATGDAAPSRWFVEQCAINPTTGRLVQGAIRPPEPDAIPKAVL